MRNAIVARVSSEEATMPTGGHWFNRLTGVMAGALVLWVLGSGVARADVAQHDAITITSNADLVPTPTAPMGLCGCVTSGTGRPDDPYVIGPWAIRAPSGPTASGQPSGWAVKVDNSGGGVTDRFVISGISAAYSGVLPPSPVIWLVDVNDSAVSNVSANGDGVGIELDNSSNITLDSISVNKMNGTGVYINHSSYVYLSNGKYKATSDQLQPASHYADGLYAVGSNHLWIGGVAGCPKTGICNTFDYDSGWGVYLGPNAIGQNTDHVVIDNATANADDTGGFVLDGASNVTLENSTSEAGGPICISLNGAKQDSGYMPTDLVGGLMLVNGTYDDTISSDTFNGTSSSSGFSIGDGGNGVLEDGVLTDNPFYFNVCRGIPTSLPPPGDQPMGPNITFANVCYSTTDIPPTPPPQQLPPVSSCKS